MSESIENSPGKPVKAKTAKSLYSDPLLQELYGEPKDLPHGRNAMELAELLTLFNESLAYSQNNEKAAQQLIEVGETRPDPTLNPRELAAWTMLANLILNLDEVINRG